MRLTLTTTTAVQSKARELGQRGPNLEQAKLRNKKLRRDGEACNLSLRESARQ
jgi:hypothetical protein